jgi:hypothetical protein
MKITKTLTKKESSRDEHKCIQLHPHPLARHKSQPLHKPTLHRWGGPRRPIPIPHMRVYFRRLLQLPLTQPTTYIRATTACVSVAISYQPTKYHVSVRSNEEVRRRRRSRRRRKRTGDERSLPLLQRNLDLSNALYNID